MKRFIKLAGALSIWELCGRYPVTAGVMTLLGVGGVVAVSPLNPPSITPQPAAAFTQSQALTHSVNNVLKPNAGTTGAEWFPSTPTASFFVSVDGSIDPALSGGNYEYALGSSTAGAGLQLNGIGPGAAVFQTQKNDLNGPWWTAVSPFAWGVNPSVGSSPTKYLNGYLPWTATGGGCARDPSGIVGPTTGGATGAAVADFGFQCATNPTIQAMTAIPNSGAQQAATITGCTSNTPSGEAQVTVTVPIAHGIVPGASSLTMTGFASPATAFNQTNYTATQGTAGTTLVLESPLGASGVCPGGVTYPVIGGTALSGTGGAVNLASISTTNPFGANQTTGITAKPGGKFCGVLGEYGSDSPTPGFQFAAFSDWNGTALTNSPAVSTWPNQGATNFTGYTIVSTQSPLSPALTVTAMNLYAITAASYSGVTGYVSFTFSTNPNLVVGSEFTVSGSNPSGYNGTYIAVAGTSGTTVVGNPLVAPLGMPEAIANPGSYVSGASAVGVIVPGMGVFGAIGATTVILPYGTFGGTGTGGAGTYGLSANQVTTDTFTASSSGTTMTVTGTPGGALQLAIGEGFSGSGVIGSPVITAYGTGTGGAGTYTVENQDAASSGGGSATAQYLGRETGAIAAWETIPYQTYTSGVITIALDEAAIGGEGSVKIEVDGGTYLSAPYPNASSPNGAHGESCATINVSDLTPGQHAARAEWCPVNGYCQELSSQLGASLSGSTVASVDHPYSLGKWVAITNLSGTIIDTTGATMPVYGVSSSGIVETTVGVYCTAGTATPNSFMLIAPLPMTRNVNAFSPDGPSPTCAATFTGSVSGTTLTTTTAASNGQSIIGMTLLMNAGLNCPASGCPTIVSGPAGGAVGTYTLSASGGTISLTTLAAGDVISSSGGAAFTLTSWRAGPHEHHDVTTGVAKNNGSLFFYTNPSSLVPPQVVYANALTGTSCGSAGPSCGTSSNPYQTPDQAINGLTPMNSGLTQAVTDNGFCAVFTKTGNTTGAIPFSVGQPVVYDGPVGTLDSDLINSVYYVLSASANALTLTDTPGGSNCVRDRSVAGHNAFLYQDFSLTTVLMQPGLYSWGDNASGEPLRMTRLSFMQLDYDPATANNNPGVANAAAFNRVTSPSTNNIGGFNTENIQTNMGMTFPHVQAPIQQPISAGVINPTFLFRTSDLAVFPPLGGNGNTSTTFLAGSNGCTPGAGYEGQNYVSAVTDNGDGTTSVTVTGRGGMNWTATGGIDNGSGSAGNTLTVTAGPSAATGQYIYRTLMISGSGIAPGTQVTGYGTGSGLNGTYTVSGAPQFVAPGTTISASFQTFNTCPLNTMIEMATPWIIGSVTNLWLDGVNAVAPSHDDMIIGTGVSNGEDFINKEGLIHGGAYVTNSFFANIQNGTSGASIDEGTKLVDIWSKCIGNEQALLVINTSCNSFSDTRLAYTMASADAQSLGYPYPYYPILQAVTPGVYGGTDFYIAPQYMPANLSTGWNAIYQCDGGSSVTLSYGTVGYDRTTGRVSVATPVIGACDPDGTHGRSLISVASDAHDDCGFLSYAGTYLINGLIMDNWSSDGRCYIYRSSITPSIVGPPIALMNFLFLDDQGLGSLDFPGVPGSTPPGLQTNLGFSQGYPTYNMLVRGGIWSGVNLFSSGNIFYPLDASVFDGVECPAISQIDPLPSVAGFSNLHVVNNPSVNPC